MDVKSKGFEQPGVFAAVVEPMPDTPTSTPSSSMTAVKDISFGSIAGSIGKVVEYPFDTVKVRLQSQPDHLPLQYTGPLDCFRQSIRKDGVRGLYRGISAPIVGAAAETASLFFAYNKARQFLRATVLPADTGETLPMTALITAGAISGGVTSLILTPIELVKCRMQVPLQSPMDPSLSPRTGLAARSLSPFAVISDVYRQEGLRGFWRGQLGTLIREMGGSAAWFGSYEVLSLYFKHRIVAANATTQQLPPHSDALIAVQIPVYQQMLSGAVAGMSYNFLFFPADTIKSKMQTEDLAALVGGRKPSFMSVGRALWRAHGVKGLYRGCGITVARSAPSSALIFSIYESLKKSFA